MPSSSNAVFIENGRFVDYFGNPIDISTLGLVGPTGSIGPTGPAGSAGSAGSTSSPIKFVKEFFPLGPTTLTITRSELLAAVSPDGLNPGIILTPPAGGLAGNDIPQFPDMSISMWSFIAGATQWNHIMTEGSIVSTGVPSNNTRVNVSNGDIEIDYKFGGAIIGQRIRVIIII
jgi:hypothetical protein